MDELLKREREDNASLKGQIEDLVKRITEIELEYEEKISRKEQQLWNVNAQRQEEASKLAEEKARAVSAASKKKEEALAAANATNKSTVDNEVVSDLEKRWQSKLINGSLTSVLLGKERGLLKEIEDCNTQLREKHGVMQSMASKIFNLEREQFHPRMQYLQEIEMIMKQKLMEFSVSEEKMEVGLMCPRDLKLYEKPITLQPCGHTFCSCCIDELKQENFNILKCSVCKVVSESSFANGKLASLCEQFIQRKQNTKLFSDWLKTLNTYSIQEKSKALEKSTPA